MKAIVAVMPEVLSNNTVDVEVSVKMKFQGNQQKEYIDVDTAETEKEEAARMLPPFRGKQAIA